MALQPLKSRFWTLEEDIKLVESLLDLYHDGKFYADNNFKSDYLRALETTSKAKLPGCGIQAKPRIESMLTGLDCSGFGWDPKKKIITADKAVWDVYILATNFKNKAFPHFEDLCMIYSKDHATRKNAEAPADVAEELERTESSMREFESSKNIKSPSRRRRRNEDSKDFGKLKELATLIIAQMKDSSNVVIGLSEELKKISGLTTMEQLKASTQIARDSATLNVFTLFVMSVKASGGLAKIKLALAAA
ncbi:Myb DNA-bind 3 domain-containing protein [Citrus sinensis]|nr:Myb DNA-bind 3 domain-containing protein [Citrus sinensis]